MEEKKSFFDLLDPKSALTLGLVGGFLSIGTIAAMVMGVMLLKGDSTPSYTAPVAQQPQVQQPVAEAPTPEVPKAAKAKAELFVMSYCPYGLQTQKALLPVMDLLKGKADIDVKFVSYIMHDKKELDENTRQYCIQKDQNAKYVAYLKCFAASGDSTACGKEAGISESKVTSCVNAANKQFGILTKYNDQSSWLGGRFPIYPVHEALNNKYGVEGSPTLVINGTKVEGVARTPEALKKAICAGFNNAPAECNQVLSNSSYDPGFGMTLGSAGGTAAPGCGV